MNYMLLKLDRLGRDNRDVQNTVDLVLSKGVKLFIHDLPVIDLTTAEGKMILQLFSTFAEFEKNRISERTKEGLARSSNKGGRPQGSKSKVMIQVLKSQDKGQSEIAAELGISRSTVIRNWS